jgi:micrococcal nuclease
MARQRVLTILAVLAALAGLASAAERLTCVKVIDGDSLVLRMPHGDQEARLDGIDAPELSQRFGSESRDFLAGLVMGRPVDVEIVGADNYGRLLVRLRVNGELINLQAVSEGFAWHFKRYSNDQTFDAAEKDAAARRIGLWRDPSPVPPWEYRHGKPAELRPLLPNSSARVHGNRASGVYHLQSCRNYDCKNCILEFESSEAALAAGFRPAGCCAARKHPGNDR